MKNKKGYLRLLVGILTLVMLLSSCGSTTLCYDAKEKGYVRSGDGAVFYRASKNYSAAAIDKNQQLASLEQNEGSLPLYAVYGNETGAAMDTNAWMADEAYTLYHAKDTALPKLWEMEVDRIRILPNSDNAFILGYVTEAAEIAAVVNSYREGESFAFRLLQAELVLMTYQQDYEKYELAFSSTNYNGLFYMLNLYHFESDVILDVEDASDGTIEQVNVGKNIILDPVTSTCYPIEGVFDKHFD